MTGLPGHGQVPASAVLPPQPTNFKDPFWYSSLQSFWLYFPADPALVGSLLPAGVPEGQGLTLAEFDDLPGKCLVSLDFQLYTSGWDSGLSVTREIEFNVYVFPETRAGGVPRLSVADYLAGNDQTKTIGGYRLHVPCDNPVAVDAGQELYGEPKWTASFVYSVPSLNAPNHPATSWQYAVHSTPSNTLPPGTDPPDQTMMFQISADLSDVPVSTANSTALIEYGSVLYENQLRVIANFWNFFGKFDTYLLDADRARDVTLTFGSGPGSYDPYDTRRDVADVIGTTLPVAAQVFTSAPVSSECRGFFPL
jgi:hypothetical protein